MTRFVVTDTAQRELREILAYIENREGEGPAHHVLDKFNAAFEFIAGAPQSGSLKPQLTGRSVRWKLVATWWVLYDPTTPVSILRVIYGGRDLVQIFREA